jgi:threonine aldolase
MQNEFSPSEKRGFGSDNHAPIHPDILKSIESANKGHAPSYGTDTWTELACVEFKKHFGPDIDVHFVFNGTAANVLSLRTAQARFETTLCSDVSHIHHDECGAPEFFAGKTIPVKSENGKISIAELDKFIIRKGDQHFSQPRVVTITQPTELGTCYTIQEIRDLCQWAQKNQLYVHVDGARLTNAVVYLNTDYKTMLTETGVDILSFGGTKNGLMFGEAVIIFNSKLKKDFKYIKKQSAQLPSKTRFIACQFTAYFKNDLCFTMAKNSLDRARELYLGLKTIPGLEIDWAPESNAVFPKIPKIHIKTLRDHSFFYVWDESSFVCRLMTSWDTTPADVENFIEIVRSTLTKSS